MRVLSRRMLLWSAATAASVRPGLTVRNDEQTHKFQTADFDIGITIEFHDRYSSRGFWFQDESRQREFCLSANGEQGRNCLKNFEGSLAIAKYSIRPRSKQHTPALSEHVRTIDYDPRLAWRPPFHRAITLQHGQASDIQAFGFESESGSRAQTPQSANLWYLLRQDLYLETQASPFAILYWKHALNAIRILDVIPGDQTWPMK
jgi:hypothetical protein